MCKCRKWTWRMSTVLHQRAQTIAFTILGYGKFLARTLTSFPKALRWIYSNVSVNVCRTNNKTDRPRWSDTRFRCVNAVTPIPQRLTTWRYAILPQDRHGSIFASVHFLSLRVARGLQPKVQWPNLWCCVAYASLCNIYLRADVGRISTLF